MRSALPISRQDLSCYKLSLALLDPSATNLVFLSIIKLLLASHPFLKSRGGPAPLESWGGYRTRHYCALTSCLLRRAWQVWPEISEVRWDLRAKNSPLSNPFFTHHQTPLPFLHSKLRIWHFQQIPWVPKVILQSWGLQETSTVQTGLLQQVPLWQVTWCLGWEIQGN